MSVEASERDTTFMAMDPKFVCGECGARFEVGDVLVQKVVEELRAPGGGSPVWVNGSFRVQLAHLHHFS